MRSQSRGAGFDVFFSSRTNMFGPFSPPRRGEGHDRAPARSHALSQRTTSHAKHSKLVDLGLEPHLLSNSLLDSLMNITKCRDPIDRSLVLPQVDWRRTHDERRQRP